MKKSITLSIVLFIGVAMSLDQSSTARRLTGTNINQLALVNYFANHGKFGWSLFDWAPSFNLNSYLTGHHDLT